MLLALLFFSFVGPLFYPHGVDQIDLSRQLLPPSLEYPFGTDELGQNELVQMMVGGQLPILGGFVTALLASAVGVVAGLLASFSSPALDNVIMRVTDTIFGIPQVVPVFFIEAVLGASAMSLY
ncbi:MAG: hypothetical protein M0Z66_05135 [Thermaerobacter sp.]|nr:hypothetical protein [Thermaerobacter sp.]